LVAKILNPSTAAHAKNMEEVRPMLKSVKKRLRASEALSEAGFDPLRWLIAVAQDERQPHDVRMDAAKTLLPYAYAKRSPEDADGNTQATTVILPSILAKKPDQNNESHN
jgi:hypothetical protein